MARFKRALPTTGRPAIVRGKDARITFRLPEDLRKVLVERARIKRASLSDVLAIVIERGLAVVRPGETLN